MIQNYVSICLYNEVIIFNLYVCKDVTIAPYIYKGFVEACFCVVKVSSSSIYVPSPFMDPENISTRGGGGGGGTIIE